MTAAVLTDRETLHKAWAREASKDEPDEAILAEAVLDLLYELDALTKRAEEADRLVVEKNACLDAYQETNEELQRRAEEAELRRDDAEADAIRLTREHAAQWMRAEVNRLIRKHDALHDTLYSLGHNYLSPEHTAWCKPCRAARGGDE